MLPRAVVARRRYLHVAGLRELARWPMHGIVPASCVAFRFDGKRLTVVRIPLTLLHHGRWDLPIRVRA